MTTTTTAALTAIAKQALFPFGQMQAPEGDCRRQQQGEIAGDDAGEDGDGADAGPEHGEIDAGCEHADGGIGGQADLDEGPRAADAEIDSGRREQQHRGARDEQLPAFGHARAQRQDDVAAEDGAGGEQQHRAGDERQQAGGAGEQADDPGRPAGGDELQEDGVCVTARRLDAGEERAEAEQDDEEVGERIERLPDGVAADDGGAAGGIAELEHVRQDPGAERHVERRGHQPDGGQPGLRLQAGKRPMPGKLSCAMT